MSSDGKETYNEKTGSPAASSSEVIETGNVSGFRKRLPKFSLAVRQEESSFAATKNASNADFDPIPPSKRTWNWGAYVAYWMADAWAVSNWEVGEYPAIYFASGIRKRGSADSFVQLHP
jgi:NCS1 family nucleobase:cation symporter-1